MKELTQRGDNTKHTDILISSRYDDVSFAFHWAPCVSGRPEHMGSLTKCSNSPDARRDTRPFGMLLRALYEDTSESKSSFTSQPERHLQMSFCRVASRAQPEESWVQFCAPPDVLLLNLGVWHFTNAAHGNNDTEHQVVPVLEARSYPPLAGFS